jgi:polyisoprenyl-teichoic acid--peptidoglycan teichoic acid transferase
MGEQGRGLPATIAHIGRKASHTYMRRRLKRILLVFCGLLLVVALWFGWYAYRVYQGVSNITGQTVATTTDEPKVAPISAINGTQRVNILVLGSDNDRKSQEKYPLSQSMIVVSIDPVNYKVTMLSIPRDLWVTVGRPGKKMKIDLAMQVGAKRGGFAGGIQLARATVKRLFKIPINFYAWVGLTGFTNVINTFGGITIDVKHPVLDDFYPNDVTPIDPYAFKRVFIAPGWRHLSGSQALEYVRSRHGDLLSDFGRSDRQQQVLGQLRQKINGMNLLFDLPGLVQDLQGSVKTDLSLSQIYDLEQLSHKISPARITHVVLQAPTFCTYGNVEGQSVLLPNWAAILSQSRLLAAAIPTTTPTPLPAISTPTPHPGATPSPQSQATTQPAATPTAAPAATATPPAIQDWNGPLPGNAILIKSGQVTEITRAGGVQALSPWAGSAMPAVSANGKKVAFVQYRGFASDLEVVNRKGSVTDQSPRQLTHDENKDVHNNLWALWPAWTPDGKSLLFSWDSQKLATPESEGRALDLAIWSMPVSGGTPVQLTSPAPGAGGDTDPQWRPHSSQFIYIGWSYDSLNQPAGQLKLFDTVTGRSFALSSPTARLFQAQVDPSGKRVTYIRTGLDGVDQLDVANIVDDPTGAHLGHPTILATGQIAEPAFTPDGKWVSFIQADGSGFSLYLERSTGGTHFHVAAAGSDIDSTSRPVWTR